MNSDKIHKRKYSIETYDPQWVIQFENIKRTIEKVFGSKALDVQHVGSTSIPGMKSKPLIDVLVIVKDMESFTSEKAKMQRLGYEWGENYIEPNSLLFFKTIHGDQKIENIHVLTEGSSKTVQFVSTRDYMRTHPERALEYSNLKEHLKQEFPDDYTAYRAGKQTFLEETERLTKEWLKNV